MDEIGDRNEQRVLEVCNILIRSGEFTWMKGIARRTKTFDQDDRKGIDIMVPSDVGDLYLQVKSAHKEATAFRKVMRERFPDGDIVVVLVRPSLHQNHLLIRVSRALQEAREKRIKRLKATK